MRDAAMEAMVVLCLVIMPLRRRMIFSLFNPDFE